MKKLLIIAFAISVLFLSACGSVFAQSASAHSSVSYAPPVATASVPTVCLILHDRQAQLNQEDQAARTQLTAAQAHGDQLQVGEAEKTLMRLHQLLAQVPALCSSASITQSMLV